MCLSIADITTGVDVEGLSIADITTGVDVEGLDSGGLKSAQCVAAPSRPPPDPYLAPPPNAATAFVAADAAFAGVGPMIGTDV